MKFCTIQPPYSMDYSRADELFAWELDALDQCDDSMDVIVLPEYSNVPAYAATKEEMLTSYRKYSEVLMEKAAATARRCGATVFVNAVTDAASGLRNSTLAFSKTGDLAGRYDKQHLVPSEMNVYELDKDYTYEYSAPTVLEIDGVRYGFLICYDFYFYEAFSNLARFDPEVIIACAYMRSDSHDTLEMLTKFCAYNTNAYVVRSSVSLGADSPVGGCSMIAAPNGSVLVNMKNNVGMACAELDPHARHLKAAGFGNPPAPHHHYIEAGRRPWKYRPAGSATIPGDDQLPYPRICAHRGFNTIAPENSMPAFGAAIALGAQEIEFDLWSTRDGVIVSIHDPVLDRVSNGHGYVDEASWDELKELDFGSKHGAAFAGLRIPTFADILRKFARQVIMNVHVKARDDVNPLPEATVREIVRLIDQYDCRSHCYIMSGNPAILQQFRAIAPDLNRCAGASLPEHDLVEKALATGSKIIQLYKPHFEVLGPGYVEDVIRRAHAHGIAVNLFYSNDPEEVCRYLELGVDTVLTDDYQRISAAVEPYRVSKYAR